MKPSSLQTAVIIQRDNIDGGSKPPVTIVGFMPEEFVFGVTSTYEQPFAESMNELVARMPVVGSRLSKTTRITSPFLTASYWQGSEVSDMSLTLAFEADSDPLEEVRQPILDLLSLVTPRYLDGLIVSPTDTLKFTDEQVQKMVKNASEATTTVVNTTASVAKNLVNKATGKDENIKDEEDDSILSGIIETGNKVASKVQNFCKGLANDVMEGTAKVVGEENISKLKGLINPEEELASKDAKQDNKPNAKNTIPVSRSITELDISPATQLATKLPSAISMKIGTYIEFPSIVITGVNTTFNSQIDAYTGWPMSATVELTFRPLFSTCYGDVQRMFTSEPKPVVDKDMYEKMQEPVNSQLTSSLTSGITSFVKDTAGKFTNAATSAIGNASKSVSSGISDLFSNEQ